MPRLIYRDSDGIDRTIDLGADPILIGRAGECQVQTQDALVSRRHARITWDGGYWIEDLGSSNGVWIGSERVQKAPFRPGDEVRCGSLIMRLVPDVSRPANRPIDANDPTPARRAVAVSPPAPAMASPPPGPAAQGGGEGGVLEERNRRLQAEAAVLQLEQRANTAESKLEEAQDRLRSLEQRVADAEAAVEAANERARVAEQNGKDGEKWRRKVEQLTADLRRLRGGEPPEEKTNADGGPSAAALSDITSERDRLRQRVADLEAQWAAGGAGGAPMAGDDSAMLRRKVEQLTSEVRRLRGGQPASPALMEDGRVAELEAKLAQAEKERDDARRAAAAAAAAAAAEGASPEVDKLKRMIDQLTAENRRMRQGAGVPPEDARIAELTARAEKAEQERDAAKRAAAAAALSPAAAGPVDPAIGEAVSGVDDALADLRGSLRAAMDEVGVLGAEAPSDSVQVLRDALTAANEQMDMARGKIREARALLETS